MNAKNELSSYYQGINTECPWLGDSVLIKSNYPYLSIISLNLNILYPINFLLVAFGWDH